MRRKQIAQACLTAGVPLLTAAVALCQDPYGSPAREPSRAWYAILFAVVFVAAICVVAFKHARRTHLD